MPTRANVIALGARRKAARADTRRRRAARSVVTVWIAVGALGVLLLIGEVASVVLRHGLPGLAIATGVLAMAAWPLAGRIARRGTSPISHNRPISSQRYRRPLKPIPRTAEGKDGDR